MREVMKPYIGLVIGMALVLGAGGCGGDSSAGHNPISGEVRLDGQPLERGSILFVPIEGTKGQAAGGVIENGRYQIGSDAGPAVGAYRVEIRGVRKTGKRVQKPLAPPGELTDEEAEAVAARFNSASRETVDVKAGENTANFQVHSK
ncbi:MAG: hypothetical protein EXS09_03015 [Gemmataceae bacterium]|nr:hypothetical protein [Gemmataceae bacterium]